MHHGGSFTTNGKKYLGGKISYFDYCDEDLMSLLELEDMAEQVGCNGKMYFHYFDKNGVQLQLLDDDHFWALFSGLFKSSNKYKVVIIYVSQLRDEVNEVSVGVEVNEDLGGACLTYEQPVDCDVAVEQEVELEAEEEDEESDSDKSTYLDYFSQNDYDSDEDDKLFDVNIDKEVEWGGVKANVAKEKEVVVEVDGQPSDDEFPMSDDELKSMHGSSDEDEDGGKERVNWPEEKKGFPQ